MALITCRDLALGYSSDAVVSELNFEVNSGDRLCIVGENGSGKSTLIKALAGLIKPISGEILLGDGLGKNQIGYLPQATEVQRDFPASVYEIVLSGRIGAHALPFYTQSDKTVARESMSRLGISELEKRSFCTLSGGQKQRVLLARAICASSRLLLLDEPVTGLDSSITHDLYSLIGGLHSEGMTVITVSHDLSLALDGATHVLHVGATPKFFGRVSDYLDSEVYHTFIKRGGAR